MNIKHNINSFTNKLSSPDCTLIAVSKRKPPADVMEAYEAGQRDFGENKVQELTQKALELPKDIRWHMIGHLQRNKVKYIAPFVSLIHSVDSLKLLLEIEKQGTKSNRVIPCLLQVFIADEESKFGLSEDELMSLIKSSEILDLSHIKIEGLMGMATNTANKDQTKKEFDNLKSIFDKIKNLDLPPGVEMNELSMGMTGDYEIALEAGSTMIRVGSAIFGPRDY